MSFRLTLAAILALSVSGCVTSSMWENNSPNTSKAVHHPVASDQIHAFGVVNQDNSRLEKGSIVMMGEKYWFVVEPQDSKKLIPVLNVKLDRQFQIVDKRNHDKPLKALPVKLKEEKSAEFSSGFCLRYDTDKTDEAAKLQNLSFQTGNSKNKSYYYRCVNAEGKYYATPKNLPADYKFEQSVPVEISYTSYKDRFSGARLAGNILMTPLTLAADAFVGVFIFPFALMTFNP